MVVLSMPSVPDRLGTALSPSRSSRDLDYVERWEMEALLHDKRRVRELSISDVLPTPKGPFRWSIAFGPDPGLTAPGRLREEDLATITMRDWFRTRLAGSFYEGFTYYSPLQKRCSPLGDSEYTYRPDITPDANYIARGLEVAYEHLKWIQGERTSSDTIKRIKAELLLPSFGLPPTAILLNASWSTFREFLVYQLGPCYLERHQLVQDPVEGNALFSSVEEDEWSMWTSLYANEIVNLRQSQPALLPINVNIVPSRRFMERGRMDPREEPLLAKNAMPPLAPGCFYSADSMFICCPWGRP